MKCLDNDFDLATFSDGIPDNFINQLNESIYYYVGLRRVRWLWQTYYDGKLLTLYD